MRRRDFLRSVAILGSVALAGRRRPASAQRPAARPLIEHLIVILRENHSYDNYFGTFPGGNGKPAGSRCEDVRPDPPHLRYHALQGVTVGINGYCHYLEDDIPNYFAYARAFTLCDNYFADILGPSYPNYFMLMAAQTHFPQVRCRISAPQSGFMIELSV